MVRRLALFAVLFCFSVVITGCSWKKSTTDSSSQLPVADSGTIGTLSGADLLPSGVKGTKQISLAGNNVFVQDDGMRQVFVDSASGAQADEVLGRLTATSDTSVTNKTELSLKQATVNVSASSIRIPEGAVLFDHLVGYNATITVSGSDLLISADLQEPPFASWIYVKETLTENYLITNPQDRFWASIYMIPRQSASLLQFVRWSDLQNVTLSYSTGETAQSVASAYEDKRAGLYTVSEELAVPSDTLFALSTTTSSPSARVYQLVFEENSTTDLDDLESIPFARAKDHLLTYTQERGFGVSSIEEIDPTVSGDWQITTTDDPEQAVFVIEPAHSTLFPLHHYPFTVELQKDASDEFRPYYSRFLTSYPLDNESVTSALEQLFGEKNVQYQSWDKGFSYEIQPQQTYTWTLLIKNIYGEEAALDVSYRIETIDKKAITQEIVSNNTISILPSSGVFKDILIQYKNIPSFNVKFQSCTINSAPDVLSAYKWVGLENYLFACGGAVVDAPVAPQEETFTYWRAYRTPIDIPEAMSGAAAFKVFFTDQAGQEQAHYMMKSDIGLWTKITDNQIWIWWFTFADGQPLEAGEVKVTNLEGTTMGTATIQDGLAKISLPNTPTEYDYVNQRKKDTYLIDVNTTSDRGFVIAHRAGRGDLAVPATAPNASERYLKINSKLDISELLGSSNQINTRGMIDPLKIYGYTDRWLYKAGDTVNFAGWVRNVLRFDDLDYLKDLRVSVTITNPLQGDPVVLDQLPLDSFGGFEWSYALPSTLPLGEYLIEYRLDDRVAYTHNIKVEEYQKPTFFVDITHQIANDMVTLVMQPSYFFGSPLQAYDVKVNRSLVGKDICRYCRRWNEDAYYYNHVFQDTTSTWGSFTLYNQTAERLLQPLYSKLAQAQKWYQYTLKIDAIVKDRLSDETQFVSKYIDFVPEVMLWLAWQPYERLYKDRADVDPRTDRTIEGKIDVGRTLVDKLSYEVYRWSYDQEFQQGVDGNLYYIQGQGYLPVSSWALQADSTFTVPTWWITKPGEYFVRVIAADADGEVVGEVQKRVSWYESSETETDLLGAVPNTYTLTVNIPKKTFTEGESIPVDIMPYQRDAWVVVTVEKGQYIIDTFLKKLDGSQLTIPVKKGYAPNVIISVMMLQGTEMNTTIRQEPRFFAGYAEAEIDMTMQQLAIAITSDKPTYAPGEQVKLTVTTTDALGRPVDARVSVAVVDQALSYLYTIIKEPLPYFFNKVGTNIFTYTNMKLLYQSLKAFATGGAKWWAGQWGKAMFSYIRDDLKDAAFRSGAIYTKGGKAEVSFVAPENITTWLIDVVGITTDTRLGTTTNTFVVTKDLIIEPNAPLFVTLGDQLTVPVKVIVPWNNPSGKVRWSAWLINQQGDRLDLGTFVVDPNSTLALPVAIPQERWTSTFVELVVDGRHGSAKDAISTIIPLRSEGLISRDSVATINTAGTHTFTIPESLSQTLSVRLGQLPTNFIDPVATYLIHYPYGCTEQLLSSLLPLIAIDQLREKGVFTSPLLSGSMLLTDQWPMDIESTLRDGVAKLLAHQRADGGFDFRASPEQTEVTRSIYLLSAYVYNSLKLLEQREDLAAQITPRIERLENFLVTHRTTAAEGRYQYLLTKATHKLPFTPDEQTSLNTIRENTPGYLPLIRYLIAVAQQDVEAMTTWRPVANIPTNEQQRMDTQIFWNPVTATAMKLGALIDDPEATQQERSELLLSLLRQRDQQGLRGYSTQNNLQVLLTLGKLATFRQPKASVTCELVVDGTSYDLVVMTGSELREITFTGTTTTVDWTCDSPLLADIAVSFLPKEPTDLLWAENHVTDMERSISDPAAAIGASVEIVGSFSTDLAGQQVAVEMFVPSDYKLLEVISTRNTTQLEESFVPDPLPFTVSDPHCLPTHREARFDRLFLYYEVLQPWVCDITISALKAYNGTTTIMPMRVWEMYRGLINGRKVIVR
jgi:hypothetical protein